MAAATTTPRKAPANAAQKDAPKPRGAQRPAVKKTADLSEQVLKELQAGQRSAIAAVREFVGSADEAAPSGGDGPSRAHAVVDSALEMSERLVQIQYDFVSSVVRSVGNALSGSSAKS